jgi:hypothetical protein
MTMAAAGRAGRHRVTALVGGGIGTIGREGEVVQSASAAQIVVE